MRGKFVGFALMLAILAAPGATAEPESSTPIVGVYHCEGTNPDGSGYAGTVEIAAAEDTFLVLWNFEDGGSMVGVGMFSNGVLAVSYFGGVPAVAVYKIDKDRLVGEWTIGADGGKHPETLTRMAPGAPGRTPGRTQPRPQAPKPAPLPAVDVQVL